jgi:hypothetical protein
MLRHLRISTGICTYRESMRSSSIWKYKKKK